MPGMMPHLDCPQIFIEAPAGALARTVDSLSGSIVVRIPRGARRAAIAEVLPSRLFPLEPLGEGSLPELAAAQPQVPGRCVVLARQIATGWQILVTPGGWTGPSEPTLDPTPIPLPVEPDRLEYLWGGMGLTAGAPNVVGGFVTLQVGPVVGEAAASTILVWSDAYWRAGLMIPVRTARDRPRLQVGALVGQRAQSRLVGAWLLESEDRLGVSTALNLDAYLDQDRHLALLVRTSLGMDWFPERAVPSLQLGCGLVFGR
jgi:hypothetical protein